MRALLVISWGVGVLLVGLCHSPPMWIWIPLFLGALVGCAQAFAIPPEHRWRWIGAAALIFGIGSLIAFVPAFFLTRGTAQTMAFGTADLNLLRLVLSWLLTAGVTGWAQRRLYARWGLEHRADVTDERRRWERKVFASFAFALVGGALVGGAAAIAELRGGGSETTPLFVMLAVAAGLATGLVVLLMSLAVFATHARISQRGSRTVTRPTQ